MRCAGKREEYRNGLPPVGGCGGRRVASAIKALSPKTRVVLLTGWGQHLAADGEAIPHVDHILAKPPKLRDLRDVLREVGTGER